MPKAKYLFKKFRRKKKKGESIDQLEDRVNDVAKLMHENIDKLIERDDKIILLEEKAGELQNLQYM